METTKEYDQSIVNLLRWHYRFDLKQCEKILEAHNEMNKFFWMSVDSPTYFPVKVLVEMLNGFNGKDEFLALSLASIRGAAAGKKLAETLRKFKATPEEAERFKKALELKGWKRFFPKYFGL